MMEIRSITPRDVDACYDIVLENWNATVATRFLAEVSHVWAEVDDPPMYYVAVVDGEVVGFAGMIRSWIMQGIWDFIWINIKKDFHGRGIGTELTEYRLREVLQLDGRAVHLMTQSPNYFDQFGFSLVKDYNGWCLMTLELGPVEM